MTSYNDLLGQINTLITSTCVNIDTVPAALSSSWSKVITTSLGGVNNRTLSVTINLANPVSAVTTASVESSTDTLFDNTGLTSTYRDDTVKIKGFSFLMKQLSDFFSSNIKYASNPNNTPNEEGFIFNDGAIVQPSGSYDYSLDNSYILSSMEDELSSYVENFISTLVTAYPLYSQYVTHNIA